MLASALTTHAALRHLKIEDGSGRPLGRSFKVKLWPALILVQDGKEIARLVRPSSTAEIVDMLAFSDTRR
jgi:thioredoxin 1